MEFIAKHFDFRDVAVNAVDFFYFNLEGNETSSTISKCREGCSFCSSFSFFFRYPAIKLVGRHIMGLVVFVVAARGRQALDQ